MSMQSGTGLKRETAGALSYIFGFISGFIFLLLEKDRFVRFHALQSIVVSLAFFIVTTLLSITVVFAPINGLVTIAGFVLWLMMIYQASQGKEWEAPIFGKVARQLLGK